MIMVVPEGYSTVGYYFVMVAMYAFWLFLQAFLWYIYYGLPLTLAFVVYRVFRKRNEPIGISLLD